MPPSPSARKAKSPPRRDRCPFEVAVAASLCVKLVVGADGERTARTSHVSRRTHAAHTRTHAMRTSPRCRRGSAASCSCAHFAPLLTLAGCVVSVRTLPLSPRIFCLVLAAHPGSGPRSLIPGSSRGRRRSPVDPAPISRMARRSCRDGASSERCLHLVPRRYAPASSPIGGRFVDASPDRPAEFP